jgi:hypothetical protein
MEGGWREQSIKLEPPLGGGQGEPCVKSCRPKDGFNLAVQSSFFSSPLTTSGSSGMKTRSSATTC